jgi:hypothetical protein
MIRISVISAEDRERVAEIVRKAIAENKPVALTGDEFRQALQKHRWPQTWRIGEPSAIEFRTMGLCRSQTLAQAEKPDLATAGKLTKMAEDRWERLAQEAKKENQPGRRIREADAKSPFPFSLTEPRKCPMMSS